LDELYDKNPDDFFVDHISEYSINLHTLRRGHMCLLMRENCLSLKESREGQAKGSVRIIMLER